MPIAINYLGNSILCHTGERPYEYKRIVVFKFGEMFQPSVQLNLNTITLVHVRAFTFVLSRVLAKLYYNYDCRPCSEF